MKIYTFIFSLLIVATSCKVKYTFTGADIPPEAKTVSVAYFIAMAPQAGPQVSQQFTNDMSAMLLTQTSLDVVDELGDLRFEGTIVGYRISAAAVQANTESAAKNRLTMRVKVKYTNTIDPEKDFEREFSQFADFPAESVLSDVEESLIELIDEALVQDIFNASIGSW